MAVHRQNPSTNEPVRSDIKTIQTPGRRESLMQRPQNDGVRRDRLQNDKNLKDDCNSHNLVYIRIPTPPQKKIKRSLNFQVPIIFVAD
jgi:hypothetical protein